LSIDVQKIWVVVRILILSAVGFYVLIIFYFGMSQGRFIYFPERKLLVTPADIGLQYETVSFMTKDGIKLFAWFIPCEKQRGVLLFCHGNAGNISHRIESIQTFHSLGLSTFIFDYRGYGKSAGKPTEQGTYLDAEAAWLYLVQERKVSPDKIVVFGRSIGGTIAAWLAQFRTPKALIIESVFTSIKDMAGDLYPFLPVKQLVRFNYNAADYISRVNCPILVIHSKDDEIVPFKHGRKLFESANEPKEFLEITGSHNDGFILSEKKYRDSLNSFITKYTEDKNK